MLRYDRRHLHIDQAVTAILFRPDSGETEIEKVMALPIDKIIFKKRSGMCEKADRAVEVIFAPVIDPQMHSAAEVELKSEIERRVCPVMTVGNFPCRRECQSVEEIHFFLPV